MKLLFVINVPSFFLSHRLAIAQSAKEKGFDVHIATANGVDVKEIINLGFKHHVVPFSRSGKNILKELYVIALLASVFIRIKPDIVHLVTIKPVLYGGILARLLNVKAVVAAISGLGWIFTNDNRKKILKLLVINFYRVSLRHKNIKIIFQNTDDKETLINIKATQQNNTCLIHGSGIDLSTCPVTQEPGNRPVKVIMAARLLRTKGVNIFVDAAKILRSRSLSAHFLLVGEPDLENPSSISMQEYTRWKKEGIVDVLGFREDILQIFSCAHIVVFPSYYGEGLPKILIEAAACGRPIITTDHPGCRDVIIPGVTGLLIPVKDSIALANAIEQLAKDTKKRQEMGRAARIFAEKKFSIEMVVDQHMQIYNSLLQNKKSAH